MKQAIPFTAELNLIKSYEDQGEFHIVGYVATSDFDLQNDIISPDALEDSKEDLVKNSTMLFNHDDQCPIGKVVKQSLDDKGLLVDAVVDQTAIVPKTTTKIVDAIKQGILNKFSIRAKVLDAAKEFVSELGRMANVIKRMLLIECSLVSVPANPEAKSLGWYIKKALDEGDSMKKDKKEVDEIDESSGDPDIEKKDKGKDQEDTEKKEEQKDQEDTEKKDDSEEDGITLKAFPLPDELEKQWNGFCDEHALSNDSSVEEVDKSWVEFCEEKGYPHPYPYPYLSKKRSELEDLLALADALTKSTDETVKSIGQKIRDIATKLLNAQNPYPKPGSRPVADTTPEDKEEPAEKKEHSDSQIVERFMRELAAVKALIVKKNKEKSEEPEEKKVVRKGMIEKEEEEEEKEEESKKGVRDIRKKLDAMQDGATLQDQLRTAVELLQQDVL